MSKRARSVLTGLLVLCCAVMSFMPAAHVQMDSSGSAGRDIIVTENAGLTRMTCPVAVSLAVASASTGETTQTSTPVASPSSGPWQTAWAWIQKTTRSTGAFFASLYVSIRDFFVSGQALKVLQTATQAITDLAVRLFLPLSALVVPVLQRIVSGFSVTPELVAVWMFWVVIVLALIILILALRPRRSVGKRLPRVTPRTAGQGENTMEFGLVEQGPKPSPATSLDQLARTHEKEEMLPVQEPAAQPAMAEESSPCPARLTVGPGDFPGATWLLRRRRYDARCTRGTRGCRRHDCTGHTATSGVHPVRGRIAHDSGPNRRSP